MKSKNILLLGLTSVVACAGAQKPKEEITLNIEVERMMPSAVSLHKTAVEVILNVENPMGRTVHVTSLRYSIDTKEVAGVLQGSAESKHTIEPDGSAEITFRQEIPFPGETEAYKAIIDRSTLPIELKGELTLDDGTKLSFARISEVATPSLPKFVVHEAQAARYGKNGVDVTLFLRLINENVFGLGVEGVDYTVELNGKQVKKEQAALGIKLLAAAAEEYEVTSILDEKTFGKAEVKALLEAGLINYRVHGELELSFIKIPFEHVGEISLGGN
jgi:LEA14-like dessication related protein